MIDHRILVGLVLAAAVLPAVVTVWLLAERTARVQGRRVDRLQQRIREQRQEITDLSADNAALLRQITKYRLAAGLLVAAADPDPLEALYALPAYNPEDPR